MRDESSQQEPPVVPLRRAKDEGRGMFGREETKLEAAKVIREKGEENKNRDHDVIDAKGEIVKERLQRMVDQGVEGAQMLMDLYRDAETSAKIKTEEAWQTTIGLAEDAYDVGKTTLKVGAIGAGVVVATPITLAGVTAGGTVVAAESATMFGVEGVQRGAKGLAELRAIAGQRISRGIQAIGAAIQAYGMRSEEKGQERIKTVRQQDKARMGKIRDANLGFRIYNAVRENS